jgi:hypothetical protein
MHGYVDYAEFLEAVSGFLGWYYVAVASINIIAALYLWRSGRAAVYCRLGRWSLTSAHIWLLVAAFFVALSLVPFTGRPDSMRLVSMPESVKSFVNAVLNPTLFMCGLVLLLGVLFAARRFFVKPAVAWGGLNVTLLLLGLSLTDPNFARIVSKPDNVAIVGMLFLLGYFTWLGTYRAVQNDERLKRGEPSLEASESETVLVWPDLVYIELICMVALTALLIVWSIGVKAPLEAPASTTDTPNPSKAPWYFLGLQEMLLYYDAWMAGVVVPGLIIFGLSAIPYLDVNTHGNGYYTIDERKFAYLTHQFGFLVLWIALIVLGTFFRGPNWSFFGPYEHWDPHKTADLYNVDLSSYFWIHMLEMERPTSPEEAGAVARFFSILLRESPGIVLLGAYFLLIPAALIWSSSFFRSLYKKMRFTRYSVLMLLLLIMALLPIKMIAQWTVNLKCFISIPEYSLNF